MKKILIIMILSGCALFASSVALQAAELSDSAPLIYFSMGYFYLYDGNIREARRQFELCLRSEKSPPALIYTILSELSDILGEQEKSGDYAFEALRIDPRNETALKIVAQSLINEKKYEEALSYLQKLYELNPFEPQVLLYMAEAYSGLGSEDKLIEIYQQILKLKPDFMDARLNLGYLYTKRGYFGLAKKEYSKVLEADPENEKAIFYLTYIYLSEGNTNEAMSLFKKLDEKKLLNDEMLEDYAANAFIEDQNPKPIIDRINDRDNISELTRGILSYIENRYSEAQEHFERSVEKNPGSIAPLIGLIRISEKRDNRDMEKKWRFALAGTYYDFRSFEKALKEALMVKEIDPLFLENRYLLGDVYRAIGKKEDAIREYEYFSNRAEEKGDVYLKLGFTYDEIGNNMEAVKWILLAIGESPRNDELYYYLGVEYRILREYANAVNAFRKAIELNDQNAYYHFNLGVSLERLGDAEQAISHLEKSITLDEQNPTALNYLGYMLAEKGVRLEEAKRFIEKALSMDPNNGAYLDSLGWVYYKLTDYQKAREYLENAVKLMNASDEENYVIYEHLGDAYHKIGLIEQAVEMWKKALEMKNVEEVEKKIRQLEKEMRN